MNHIKSVLRCINGSVLFIQTHNFPDPDAVASAYGLQVLLKENGINSVICYKGRIDNTITEKMVQFLNINIVEIQEITEMPQEAEIILVDSQKGNANISKMHGNEIVCIDHHPIYKNVEYQYTDIRSDIGACASIIASYFYESGAEIDRRTATALLYGIKIDTANMTRGVSSLDLEMFYRLFPLADHRLLKTLDTSGLKMEDLKAYSSAIGSIQRVNEICFANTGMNCHEALSAAISDFILTLDSVNIVVVYSLRSDGIKLSVRSSDNLYDIGKITNEALKGIGSGGGHEHMAGGFVPFPEINGKENRDEMVKRLVLDIKDRFLEKIL